MSDPSLAALVAYEMLGYSGVYLHADGSVNGTATQTWNFGASPGGLRVAANDGIVADYRFGRYAAGVYTDRWIWRLNGTAESGGTTGSGGADMELHARKNDGTLNLVAATVNRATGVFNFAARPQYAGSNLALVSEIVAGYTDEQAQDALASLIAAGTHTGITFTYNDAANSLSAAVTGGGGSAVSSAGTHTYTDAAFANVSALLHFNGADNSTTFTDQVAGNVWTAGSTAAIKTAQSVYGGASGYFPDGANARITCPTNSRFDLGASEWTIEFRYLYISTTADVARIFQTRDGDVYCGITLSIYSGTLNLGLSSNGTTYALLNGVVLANLGTSTSVWKEVLVERYISNGQHYIFCSVDGIKVYEAAIASTALYYNSGDTVTIGGQTSGANRSACAYLEEFRLTKNQALVQPSRLWTARPAYSDS